MKTAAFTMAVMALAGPVALAAKWQTTNFSASVAMGVAMFDETRGVVAGGQNGVGPVVWKTTDGGASFETTKHDTGMMFMDAAADMGDKKHANVAGMFTSQFSNDTAASFWKALAGSGGPCQSIEAIKGTKGAVGLTGQTMFWNGVGISTDGGQHFATHAIPAWKMNSPFGARYGAFPSPTTFYATAGSWPENKAKAPMGFHSISERIHMHPKTGEVRVTQPMGAGEGANQTSYAAGIAKTTDGGKTWKVLMQQESPNGFYFNGIDCWDTTHCVAVAEADSGTGAGSRIFMTEDGETFKQVAFNQGAQYSLMAARWASATEVWAAGGEMDSAFIGAFFHSTDAGKTWTKEPLQGVYATSLSFPSPSAGFATAITQMQQSTVVKYA